MTRVLAPLADASAPQSTRHRATRAAALASTGGLLVGFGVVSAAPAFAATAVDCTDANTVSASSGDDAADLGALLADPAVPIVCVDGTFTISTSLSFDRDVTIFGLGSAVLDSDGTDRVITGDSGSNAHITLQNLTLRDGVAFGGGAVSAAIVTAINSTFLANAAAFGGAIEANVVTVTGSTFEGNTVDLEGGAISGYDSVSITDSTFLDNVSEVDGGAVTGYGTVTVDASTFIGNDASRYGGAIEADTSTIQNSTFVDNTAGDEGGAIFTGDSEVQFSTFLNNTAPAPLPASELPGDAIYLVNDGEDALAIRGNIFAGSTGNPQLGVGNIVTPSRIVDFGGNVFSTSRVTESDLIGADPSSLFDQTIAALFGAGAAPADNGGQTPTVALIEGSPAIDVVPPISEFSSAPAAAELAPVAISDLPVDQRDVARTGLADAGAFEFVPGGPGLAGEELAVSGSDPATTGWLAAIAALLLGSGAVVAIGARRRSRSQR